MPGPPAVSCPPGEATTASVARLVDELARQPEQDRDHRTPDPVDLVDTPGEARRTALVRLRVLGRVKEAVRELEDQAAHAAAAGGAGYPEIGQALGMSRQGARRRWPGLVTSTAPSPPALSPPTPRSP
jgi:hypothetical protein